MLDDHKKFIKLISSKKLHKSEGTIKKLCIKANMKVDGGKSSALVKVCKILNLNGG